MVRAAVGELDRSVGATDAKFLHPTLRSEHATHTPKPNEQSRAVLLGYLVGHVSGIDSSVSGDGFDEMRSVGVNALRSQLRALGLSSSFGPFRMSTLDSNASIISEALEKRDGMNATMLFLTGLSLAIIPMRRRQGLSTLDSEEKLITLSKKCDIEDLVTSLLSKFRSNSPNYDKAVADAITEIARRTAPKVFISYSQENSPVAVSIATYLEAKGIGTWYYERDSIASRPHLEQTKSQIDSCAAFVAVISERDGSSHWIFTEIHTAAGANKPRFPVLVDVSYEALPHEMQLAFGTNVGVAWSTKNNNIQEFLVRILRGVQAAIGE